MQHYLRHYGQKWGIRTEQEMEQHLYKPARGMRALPGRMFAGRNPEQIKKTYEKWAEKDQQTRQKISQARKGKKHTLEARAKMSAAQKKRWGKIRGDLLRIRKSRGLIESEEFEEQQKTGKEIKRKTIATTKTPETEAQRRETQQAIQQAIRELSPLQQQIIKQAFYSNKTIQQIAQQTGQTTTEIQQQYETALAQLAKNKKLGELFEL